MDDRDTVILEGDSPVDHRFDVLPRDAIFHPVAAIYAVTRETERIVDYRMSTR
jgi:hypothetical protein